MNYKHLLTLILALVFATPSIAMRCGQRIVVTGDDVYRVLQRCGEPDFSYSRVEYIRVGGLNQSFSRTVPVTIDEWVYDLGRTRLKRRLIFENGRLKKIETLGYGD